MRPIFNEKVAENEVCGTHEQYMGALFTAEKSKHVARKKKEKKRKERQTWIHKRGSKQILRVRLNRTYFTEN